MKIALLGSRGIPARYGGYETFYENLATRLVARGHSVTVYNRSNHYDSKIKNYLGVRIINIPTIKSKHLDTIFHTFVSVIHAAFQGYDIAYFCIVGNSPLTLFTRLLGVKTILNVDGEDWKRGKWRGFAKVYLKFSEYLATIFPHVVIADSQVIRKRYLEEFRRDTIFIPYGANVCRTADTRCLSQYKLEKDKYILFVGRLVPENNAHMLIEAFKRIDTDYKLVIVGDAPYVDAYKEELHGIANDNVVFTGYVFGDGYQCLSSNCYLFVLPSAVDGTRPVLLDQMGFGNCVLVNNSPANLEVVGHAGLAFNGKDGIADLVAKMKYLLSRPDVVGDYRMKAVDRVEKEYSWDVISLKYEELFKSLVEGNN